MVDQERNEKALALLEYCEARSALAADSALLIRILLSQRSDAPRMFHANRPPPWYGNTNGAADTDRGEC